MKKKRKRNPNPTQSPLAGPPSPLLAQLPSLPGPAREQPDPSPSARSHAVSEPQPSAPLPRPSVHPSSRQPLSSATSHAFPSATDTGSRSPATHPEPVSPCAPALRPRSPAHPLNSGPTPPVTHRVRRSLTRTARRPPLTDRTGPLGRPVFPASLALAQRPRDPRPRSRRAFLIGRARRDPGAPFKPPRDPSAPHPTR